MRPVKGATIGMFDGVHCGHRHLLSQLKERCDEALAVTFANHPLGVIDNARKPQLISTPHEKEELLRSVGVTPVMLRFDEELRQLTAEHFIRILVREHGIERLVLGFNNSIGSDRCSTPQELQRVSEATGVEITRATELPGNMKVNSSAIRDLIQNGNIREASRMLGRPYSLQGKVVHGKQLGRTIGFPTANIAVEHPDKLIPGDGVYSAHAVTSDGDTYLAVVNIGHRPTVDNPQSARTIEAYLDGFSGNLYDSTVTLLFDDRLREEKKFNSIDELRRQISEDVEQARGSSM